MITFNKKSLTDIADSIGILDIQEKSVSMQSVTAARTKSDGLRRLYKKKTTRIVSIEFDIFEIDPSIRRAIFDDIMLWAESGEDKWLSLEYNSGKHLIATCTKYPEYSPKDASKSLKIEFTAFDPFWYNDALTTLNITTAANTRYTGTMIVGGSAKSCPLCFEVTNIGTVAMTSVTITAGNTTMTLSGLSVAVNAKLEVGYDDNGALFMRVGTTSVLAKRTDASSDDLLLEQRKPNTVTVLTSTKATVKLMARGESL